MRAWIAAPLLAWSCLAQAWPYGPYTARLERVLDGDTVQVSVEVWPAIIVRPTVRLAGVDTPELRSGAACERRLARASREAAAAWLARGAFHLTATGRDKYGRLLAVIRRGQDDLAEALIAAGHARPYGGGKRLPWCED